MMTLEEMKLAVCEKLPELIDTHDGFWWKTKRCQSSVRWPTEGLQVCHEAEKLMVGDLFSKWSRELVGIIIRDSGTSPDGDMDITECFSPVEMCGAVAKATLCQRLEALCRVWFPERFI